MAKSIRVVKSIHLKRFVIKHKYLFSLRGQHICISIILAYSPIRSCDLWRTIELQDHFLSQRTGEFWHVCFRLISAKYYLFFFLRHCIAFLEARKGYFELQDCRPIRATPIDWFFFSLSHYIGKSSFSISIYMEEVL